MSNYGTGPGLQSGGMTVYYFQLAKNVTFTTFKKGFRMLVGDASRRSVDDLDPNEPAAHSTTFRCFEGEGAGSGSPGYGPTDSFHFPNTTCGSGIRSNIYFPRCWDGVNLDSPDHKSHVAYPTNIDAVGLPFFGSDCPSTHPIGLPVLFLEIVWDTRPFNDQSLWPKDGGQPFVFSMGDPTGFGQHADYVFGWEGDSLQRAMDTCTGMDGFPSNCHVLTLQDTDTMNSCRQAVKVPEVAEEQYLDQLPGCNPIQAGPGPATLVPNCGAPSTTTDAPVPTVFPTPVTPPWCYSGSEPNTVSLIPNCPHTSVPASTGTASLAVVTGMPL